MFAAAAAAITKCLLFSWKLPMVTTSKFITKLLGIYAKMASSDTPS